MFPAAEHHAAAPLTKGGSGRIRDELHTDDDGFAERVEAKRRARMDRVDALPADMRALVHAYGFAIVDTCMQLGVTKPRQIKHLVEMILDEFSPTRGSYSKQGVRTPIHIGVAA